MTIPHIPGYTLENFLGQGAFGSVYQAVWNGDFPCAVKVLEAGALHQEYLGAVLERLMELPPQEGLLPVYAYDLEDAEPHVSMALLPGGAVSFDDLAGQLTKDEAWSLLEQLAESLAWLHGNGMVHAGLTGGNVFVMAGDDGAPRALLADVGQAWLGDGTMERLHDQAPYVPPERWLDPDRVLQDGHAETWDVYAFGVLAWRLLNGRWPRASQLFDRVLASRTEPLTVDPPAFAEWLWEEPPPVWPGKPGDASGKPARDLILRCLALDPAARPASMEEVAVALRSLAEMRRSGPVGVAVTVAGGIPVASAGPAPLASHAPAQALHSVPDSSAASISTPLPSASVPPPLPQPIPSPIKPDFTKLYAPAEPAKPSSRPVSAPVPVPVPVPLMETEAFPPILPIAALVPSSPAPPLPDKTSSAAASHGIPQAAHEGYAAPEKLRNPPEKPQEPHREMPRESSGAGRRFATAVALLAGVGGIGYALLHRDEVTRAAASESRAREELAVAVAAEKEAVAKLDNLETGRARQRVEALSAARTEWADLVASLVSARPFDPALVEAWKPAVGPVADRLKAALEAADAEPSLLPGSLEPRWQLAEIYSALGRHEESLALLEHLARDLEMTAAGGTAPDDLRQLLTARTQGRRGSILLDAGRTMEAAPLLQAASRAYEAWTGAHPERHDIAREYAENSLIEGRALIDRKQPDDARTALARIPGLLGQPGDEGFIPQDYFTLTDSMLETAAIDSAAGKLEPAIEQHIQAVRLLLTYDREDRQSVPCRRRLANGYFELGRLLSQKGNARDASVPFSQAVKLLTELSKESPGEPGYRLQLALAYNEVARLISTSSPNAAGAKEALQYQDGSVTILRNLNEANTLDNTFRRHLAAGLVLNGELKEAAGDGKTGQARHAEAVTLLDELLAEPTLTEADRLECRRLSFRALNALGGMHEKAGRKKDAIASFTKALEATSGLTGGADPAAEQEAAATRERLKKLKPDG